MKVLNLIPVLWSLRDALNFRKSADASRKAHNFQSEAITMSAAYNHFSYAADWLNTYKSEAEDTEVLEELMEAVYDEMENPTDCGIYEIRDLLILSFSDSSNIEEVKGTLYAVNLKCDSEAYNLHSPGGC